MAHTCHLSLLVAGNSHQCIPHMLKKGKKLVLKDAAFHLNAEHNAFICCCKSIKEASVLWLCMRCKHGRTCAWHHAKCFLDSIVLGGHHNLPFHVEILRQACCSLCHFSALMPDFDCLICYYMDACNIYEDRAVRIE